MMKWTEFCALQKGTVVRDNVFHEVELPVRNKLLVEPTRW